MEIYVGNIPPTIKTEELSFLYQSFGAIVFIDIKNRCQPPFAFILFDNTGSAYNAVAYTNGCMYKGYQFQVKLLTPDDNASVITEKSVDQEPEQHNKKRNKLIPTPKNGKAGALDDPLTKVQSGTRTKYLRYLEKDFKRKNKAEEHNLIGLVGHIEIDRKKAERNFLFSNRTLKVLT